jgi:hypothetical protein
MEPPESKTSDAQSGGAPVQYSLRTIFIVMTVLAVALSGIFAGPPWASMLTGLALSLLTPMVLTIAIIYGWGYARTFCIGALFPASTMLFLSASWFVARFFWDPYDVPGELIARWYIGILALILFALVFALGLLAVGVRWMIEAPQRRERREAFRRGQMAPGSDPTALKSPES